MKYRQLRGGVAVSLGTLILISQSVYAAVPGPLEIGDTFEPLSAEIFETSKAGNKLKLIDEPEIVEGEASGGIIIKIDPSSENQRQVVEGFGASLTESSATVLNKISPAKRSEVIKNFFSPEGNHYSISRTHIASCDFSKGDYSYVDPWTADPTLSTFSLDEDRDDLMPLIKDALAASGGALKIMASPWTAPPWMKDNNEWIRGELRGEYRSVYADYLVKYFEEYKKEGVEFWAMTPLNEPSGVGKWDSMVMGGASEGGFIAADLGPKMEAAGFGDIKIFAFDQNKDHAPEYMEELMHEQTYGDPGKYIDGIAVHWYTSTILTYTDELDYLHETYPDFQILFTEGVVDELKGGTWDDGEGIGNEAPWFNREDWWDWWWEPNHGSWGYKAEWFPEWQTLQPKVSAVYRYARDIMDDLNHWVVGWIDWNMVLDELGGPNYVGNTCSAPVMINTDTEEIHYNPQFFLFGHFSKYMRPGGRIMGTEVVGSGADELMVASALNLDGSIAVAILKDTPGAVDYTITVVGKTISGTIDGDAVQTILIKAVPPEDESSSEEVSSDENMSSSEENSVSSGEGADSSSDVLESSDALDSSSESTEESSRESAQDIPSSDQSTVALAGNSAFNTLNTSMVSSIGANTKNVEVPTSAQTMTLFNVYGEKVFQGAVQGEQSVKVPTSISSGMLLVVFQ